MFVAVCCSGCGSRKSTVRAGEDFVVQCVALCDFLQCDTVVVGQERALCEQEKSLCCSVLQCVLQYVAVCVDLERALCEQDKKLCCSVLQCVCCSVLQ